MDVPQDPQRGDSPDGDVAAPQPHLPGDQAIYLPERDEQSRPVGFGTPPSQRLRTKTAPAMLSQLSMVPIEGERQGKKDEPWDMEWKFMKTWVA